MKRIVKAGELLLGNGESKICAPLCGTTIEEVLKEGESGEQSAADFLEWRIDYLNPFPKRGSWENLFASLKKVVRKPILLTYRTKGEGGAAPDHISSKDYQDLYREMIACHVGNQTSAALVDLEFNLGRETLAPLVMEAREAGISVVLSYHDFHKTPKKDFLLRIYQQMEEWGGDIGKVAVMPEKPEDVKELKEAALMADESCRFPIVAISMGELGAESRTRAGDYHSAFTFGVIAQASAPGQISVSELKKCLLS